MFSFTLVTPPAAEPVALAEAKAHARVDTSTDDALITNLITSARLWAEKYTGRAFMTQTWKLSIDELPLCLNASNAINLPRSPLQSITSVGVFADDDDSETWDADNYFTDTSREPGRLVLRLGASWPCPTRPANGVEITYVAGYGGSESVPEPIKCAIKELVAYWYAHRGDEDVSPILAARALLDPYRVRYAGL